MKVEKMVFVSKKNKTRIVFDDFVDDGDDGNENDFRFWAYMCPKCHNKYRNALKGKCSESATYDVTCSVDGCDRDAKWYVDFSEDDISFIEEEETKTA